MNRDAALEIFQLPALTDNYMYVVHHRATGKTLAVDPSEAPPVFEFLKERRWKLDYILNTHHHFDHVGGNEALKSKFGCRILTSNYDRPRIPGADQSLAEGEVWTELGTEVRVMEIPGHTLGHVAYYFPAGEAVFCGDTLFTLGCGRLFEGSAQQMYVSLRHLSLLPAATQVYCGHEYTMANARFALTVDSSNIALVERVRDVASRREQNLSTVPSTLSDELATNPFLRTDTPELQTSLGLAGESGLSVFTELRRLKDHFR